MIICFAISPQIVTKISLERAESAPWSKDHVRLFAFCYSLETQGWRSSRVRAHSNELKWRPLDLGFTLKLALATQTLLYTVLSSKSQFSPGEGKAGEKML